MSCVRCVVRQGGNSVRGVSWMTSELSVSTSTSGRMHPPQDERGWHMTVGQGAGRLMMKWIAAEKVSAGLRQAVVVVVCLGVADKTKEGLDVA